MKTIADELRAALALSPDAYVQNVDLARGRALVIRFDADAYRSASFLDDRILGPSTQGAWLPGATLSAAARQIADPRPVHFIFHTGHVGSTLVSRLLDETGFVLSLREPLPFRTLADAHDALDRPESLLSAQQFEVLRETILQLWARGYALTSAVVVKATSSVGRIAIPVLQSQSSSRAIYLNLRAEPYIATLLGGANSSVDLRGHGPGRIRRLQARCAAPLGALHALSVGELAALSWLTETLCQQDAVRQFPERMLAVDFDDLLGDVTAGMNRVVTHLGLSVDAQYLAALGASPVLKRYSKAPDVSYTPDTRATLLGESRRDNRDEITKGMNWLERVAQHEASVARVLNATTRS